MRKTSNVNQDGGNTSWKLSQLLYKYHGFVGGTGILRDDNDNSKQKDVFIKSGKVS